MKKTIKAIIVDDYSEQSDVLKLELEKFCTGIEVAKTADTIDKAVLAIKEFKPDLVFLDINMEASGIKETGFDLFKHFSTVNFKVIFVTGFPEYAIESYKYNALDFLKKSAYSIDDLQKAVDKCRHQIELESYFEQQQTEIDVYFGKKIALKLIDYKLIIKNKEDIIRAVGAGEFTDFYCLNDNKKYTILKKLKEFDELLNSKAFLRIHKSHLVNKNHIVSYDRSKDKNEVIMSNGDAVPIGKEGQMLLLAYFATL